ncbi:MAG: gamma-glutamyltransferase [Cyanobacteria bacterium P01_H01_bin.15]
MKRLSQLGNVLSSRSGLWGLGILAMVVAGFAIVIPALRLNSENAPEPELPLKQGAVATSQHLATQVGIDVLESGGNAIDAAVAIGYALAVVHPCCGNLGGGGFMTVRFADGEETFLNFREISPAALTPEIYQTLKDAENGWQEAGVPGTVAGLEYAREKYGTKSRSELLAPAIALAQEGFVLKPGDAEILARNEQKLKDSTLQKVFFPGGQLVGAGDTLVQSALANSLLEIADQGPSVFYEGKIAAEIVATSQTDGGVLTQEDLAAYEVIESEPLACDYRDYELITTPLPGGGLTVCQILGLLDRFPTQRVAAIDGTGHHLLLSTMSFAFRERNKFFGDPRFTEVDPDDFLDIDYLQQLTQEIPRDRPPDINVLPIPEGYETTHYSVVDPEGNAVSVTYTINGFFGNGIALPESGFFLNNELDDFLEPNKIGFELDHPNAVGPRKQPLSSMSPTIVTKDDELVYVLGSPGGPTITTTVAQILVNLIDRQQPLQEAIAAGKLHTQGQENRVVAEEITLTPELRSQLEDYGYGLTTFKQWGAVTAIAVQSDGQLIAVTDPRRPAGAALTTQPDID